MFEDFSYSLGRLILRTSPKRRSKKLAGCSVADEDALAFSLTPEVVGKP
jgi:hypothetical protein